MGGRVRNIEPAAVWLMAGCLALSALPGTLRAAPAQGPQYPGRIHSGAIEALVGGELTRVERTTTSRIALGVARYAAGGRLRLGVDISHSHVSDLDVLDLEIRPAWVVPVGHDGMHLVVGVGGALRQQWVGSFSENLYPVGVDFGVKALAGSRAALTVRFAWRRVLGNRISDFNESRIVASLSVWFRNAP